MKQSENESDVNTTINRIMPQSAYNATTNSSAIATKVREDILFLQDRIDRIKKLQTPNSSVLKTYQSMLDSREAVLSWLQGNGEVEHNEENDIVQVG